LTTIAFFAHDENDAAVRRRVSAFELAGFDVIGFAMRRREKHSDSWARIDLGRTHDGRMMHRLKQVFIGAKRAGRAKTLLDECDVIYARNLDMLLCAHLALQKTSITKPIVYECLDIHRLMHGRGAVGTGIRLLERRLLTDASLLVVSSPAFLREYFDINHPNTISAVVVENRLVSTSEFGSRPKGYPSKNGPLRIGWFGVLRCARSLNLLESIAERFESQVEIILRGYPDLSLPEFEARISRRENMHYLGRYRSPDDLAAIYGDIDLVWAGDFHDKGYNSRWLLPNRIYEGGYFGVPAVAPSDCETGAWIAERNAGFTINEPLNKSFSDLIASVIKSRTELDARRKSLLALPTTAFVQPKSEMRDVIKLACTHFTENDESDSRDADTISIRNVV